MACGWSTLGGRSWPWEDEDAEADEEDGARERALETVVRAMAVTTRKMRQGPTREMAVVGNVVGAGR